MTEHEVTLEHAQLVALAADVIIAIIEDDEESVAKVLGRLQGVRPEKVMAAMGAIAAATLQGRDHRAVLTQFVENIVKEV